MRSYFLKITLNYFQPYLLMVSVSRSEVAIAWHKHCKLPKMKIFKNIFLVIYVNGDFKSEYF